jgi:hypothetical protein
MLRDAARERAHTPAVRRRRPVLRRAARRRRRHDEQPHLLRVQQPLEPVPPAHRLPRAPGHPRSARIILRDWGITERGVLPTRHGVHKLGAIRQILDTYPHLPFILIGDSGQEDPEIYRDVVHEYGARILAVYIRNVTREPAARAKAIGELSEEVASPEACCCCPTIRWPAPGTPPAAAGSGPGRRARRGRGQFFRSASRLNCMYATRSCASSCAVGTSIRPSRSPRRRGCTSNRSRSAPTPGRQRTSSAYATTRTARRPSPFARSASRGSPPPDARNPASPPRGPPPPPQARHVARKPPNACASSVICARQIRRPLRSRPPLPCRHLRLPSSQSIRLPAPRRPSTMRPAPAPEQQQRCVQPVLHASARDGRGEQLVGNPEGVDQRRRQGRRLRHKSLICVRTARDLPASR